MNTQEPQAGHFEINYTDWEAKPYPGRWVVQVHAHGENIDLAEAAANNALAQLNAAGSLTMWHFVLMPDKTSPRYAINIYGRLTPSKAPFTVDGASDAAEDEAADNEGSSFTAVTPCTMREVYRSDDDRYRWRDIKDRPPPTDGTVIMAEIIDPLDRRFLKIKKVRWSRSRQDCDYWWHLIDKDGNEIQDQAWNMNCIKRWRHIRGSMA